MSIVEDMARAIEEAFVGTDDFDIYNPQECATAALRTILSGPVGDVLRGAGKIADDARSDDDGPHVKVPIQSFHNLETALDALPEEITTILEDRG